MSIIQLGAGSDLQKAVNNAQPGDIISLDSTATWRGPIELAPKSGSAPITIQSSRVSELPDGRVDPSHSGLMPKIMVPHAEQAIRTKPGAANYKFDGVEILPDPGATVLFDLVRFGDTRAAQSTLDQVPHHLTMDRCYIHGNSILSFQRGVSLNSSDSEITRCYISEITGRGMDAQAIASWNTPGRNKIVDCYLEATGENLLFGGADPATPDFIPSDVQVLRCNLVKQLTWKGKGWTIKNLLEFKNAKRIAVDGCVLENNWGGEGQAGPCVLFTVRNQEGSAPYSIVEQITFSNCTVRNSDGALNFLGSDNEKPSARASDVAIRNCLFDKIAGPFITLNGFYNVTIDRCTHLQSANLTTLYGEQSQGFKYTNNVTIDHDFGIFGDGGTIGKAALDEYAPGWTWAGSVIAKPYDRSAYPAGNDYPASLALPADFRSPFAGKGCDIDALLAAQSGTISVPIPEPTPEPAPNPTPSPAPPATAKYSYASALLPQIDADMLKLLNTNGAQGMRFVLLVNDRLYFEKSEP